MEWKTVKLGEVCEIFGRIGFRGYTIEDFVEKPSDGAITLSPTNIINGEIDLSKCKYVNWNKYYESPEIMAKEGDIVIVKTGSSVGRTAYFREVPHPITINPQFVILKNISIDPVFLAYYVKTSIFQGKLQSIVVGSAIPTLSQKNLAKLPILLPPLETQRRIAAILSSLDDKIENNNRINRNLEAQAQALFKSWFVDFEPWGGTMPDDWKEGTLGDIIEEQPKSKIQVNAAKDVKGKYPFFTSGSSIYEYNEALISGRNLYLNTGGAAGIEFYVGEAAYSTDTWCIKGIDDFTDFLYLYITSIINIIDTEYFEGSALKHLKKKHFKERKIIIPTNKIIDDFNKKVVPLFDIIMKNYSENNRLAALRDTLLPKIMKGEIAL